jgi:predicted amidohydrolase YtcJ
VVSRFALPAQVPTGAQVIDVADKTIVPGFVDTHYHPQWLAPEIHTTQVLPAFAWQRIRPAVSGNNGR